MSGTHTDGWPQRSLQGNKVKEESARRSEGKELSSERAPPGKKEL